MRGSSSRKETMSIFHDLGRSIISLQNPITPATWVLW